MKIKIILTLIISTFLFVQCRVNRDSKIGNGDVTKTEVTKSESSSNQSDSATALTNEKEQADAVVPQGEPHKGFVYVKNIIPDLIEDLRYFTTNNFMGEKVDGYEANYAILSKEAATALGKAADELREKGYVIKIYDAYRPQKAVDHFVRWSKTSDQRNKKDYYPDLAKTSLFPTYIARKSGHSKGSTIDMTICYKDTKEEVDMGSHFDYFGPPSHPSFIGKYPGGEVTEQHKQNRMMLREVMVRHGFKPYDNEWWHFTLRNEPYPTTYFIFPVK
jgi:D-alanyl-D-alanine dipeptidase